MQESLYMQFEQNVEVKHPDIRLEDVAELFCSNSDILSRCQVFPILHLPVNQTGRYVINVMDIVEKIGKKEKNLEFVTTGETEFIITYTKENKMFEWLKIVIVCIIVFFGMAFSIMTFNNDVDVGKLFSQIYQQVLGSESSGFTILEISYSIGLGVGVLFFFQHFGKWKLSQDPTPMQVQMKTYEENVNKTLIENKERKKMQKEVLKEKKSN